jgi:pimeloyl-ACP methyl ester carboxylesterase
VITNRNERPRGPLCRCRATSSAIAACLWVAAPVAWVAAPVAWVAAPIAWAAETAAPPPAVPWIERVRRAREALEWTDEVVRHDWRLQRRVGDGACRILDPEERVVHQGADAACQSVLRSLEQDGTVPPLRGPAVILLHGLGEGRDSMRPLAEHLRPRLDANVMSFGYASVRADIDAHARALASVVAGLPDADSLRFVGHSLGNLVVRRWMAVADAADLARTHGIVMLGPPNQGSDLARMVARVWPLAEQADGAARDLVLDWPRVAPTLALPTCPVGIVAGGRGDDDGFSPLLAGDDDAVVRVEETRLPGAADFLLVPVRHAAMMRHEAVQQATVEFLRHDRFAVPRDDNSP